MIGAIMFTTLVRFVADPANAYWAHTLSYVTLCAAPRATPIAMASALDAAQSVT